MPVKPTLSSIQINAVAYGLAQKFYKDIGYSWTSAELDRLAEVFVEAINKFISEIAPSSSG